MLIELEVFKLHFGPSEWFHGSMTTLICKKCGPVLSDKSEYMEMNDLNQAMNRHILGDIHRRYGGERI